MYNAHTGRSVQLHQHIRINWKFECACGQNLGDSCIQIHIFVGISSVGEGGDGGKAAGDAVGRDRCRHEWNRFACLRVTGDVC